MAEPFLEQQMHPTVIIAAFRHALDDIVTAAKDRLRYVLAVPCNMRVAVCSSVSRQPEVLA